MSRATGATRSDAARACRWRRGDGVGPRDVARTPHRDPVPLEVPGPGQALGWPRPGAHRAARLAAVRLRWAARAGRRSGRRGGGLGRVGGPGAELPLPHSGGADAVGWARHRPAAAGGCGFGGGGLPSVRSVAILPFDNPTPEPALTKEVNDAVLEAFQGRLGLRPAAEANADAVVRGRVVRYDPDVPLSFTPGQGRTDVTRRQVQITVDVELVDQREGKTLWQRQGLTVVGEYPPPQEAAGRKVALQKLVNDLVDGAQSQW